LNQAAGRDSHTTDLRGEHWCPHLQRAEGLLGNDRDRRGCDRGGARDVVRIVTLLNWRS